MVGADLQFGSPCGAAELGTSLSDLLVECVGPDRIMANLDLQ